VSPAALTTTSMPPNAAIVSAKSLFTSRSSAMSARTATALPLFARIASTVDSAALTAWAVYVKPDLSALVVDLGLAGLPDVAGIDTVRIVIPRLEVPLVFRSRPHAPDPSDAGPRLFFQRVPEGKVVKNRLHLDVRAGTGLAGDERLAALEAECARLAALGAVRVRLLPAGGDNQSCLVMQDIEGNESCLG
jgi:hypothetical protein